MQRQNPLQQALQELGRIAKTLHILEYVDDPALRRRVLIGLNKGENLHSLARDIAFGRQGRFHDRGYEAQLNRASALSLVINAIAVWMCSPVSADLSAFLAACGTCNASCQRRSRVYLRSDRTQGGGEEGDLSGDTPRPVRGRCPLHPLSPRLWGVSTLDVGAAVRVALYSITNGKGGDSNDFFKRTLTPEHL